MANVTQIGNIKNLASYLPDSVWGAIEALIDNLPEDVKRADNLNLYAVAGISTTKAEIDDDAGARPLLIIGQSTGTECYLHFHDLDADSVTAGVDVDFLVPISATSGEVTVILCLGAGWKTFWNTGLTISASTASETSAAPTNTPNAWVVYAG